MKKVIYILLCACMLLMLVACGGEELTLENYEDYIDVSAKCYDDREDFDKNANIIYDIEIEGTTALYEYDEVEVSVLVSGYYIDWDQEIEPFEETFVIKCNKGGGGSIFEKKYQTNIYTVLRDSDFFYPLGYEVIDIQGTVKK